MTTHFKYRMQRLLRRWALVGAAGLGVVLPGWGEGWGEGVFPGMGGGGTEVVAGETRGEAEGDARVAEDAEDARDAREAAAAGAREPHLPVLLVPGWGDMATTMEPLRTRLTAAGWPESRVSVLSFRDPVGSNEAHAAEIDRAVRILRGLTGSPQVDVVAHSMGGLAVRQFLLDGEESGRIRRVVFLGTPHRGTVVATISWGDGGREMVPGSDFLNRLNGAPSVPEGVRALAIRTPLDTRVIPASSAILPAGEGVENLEICCPTHQGLVDDDRTFLEVMHFLRPAPLEPYPGPVPEPGPLPVPEARPGSLPGPGAGG